MFLQKVKQFVTFFKIQEITELGISPVGDHFPHHAGDSTTVSVPTVGTEASSRPYIIYNYILNYNKSKTNLLL